MGTAEFSPNKSSPEKPLIRFWGDLGPKPKKTILRPEAPGFGGLDLPRSRRPKISKSSVAHNFYSRGSQGPTGISEVTIGTVEVVWKQFYDRPGSFGMVSGAGFQTGAKFGLKR